MYITEDDHAPIISDDIKNLSKEELLKQIGAIEFRNNLLSYLEDKFEGIQLCRSEYDRGKNDGIALVLEFIYKFCKE